MIIRVTKLPQDKIARIKISRLIFGLSLIDAKYFVEDAQDKQKCSSDLYLEGEFKGKCNGCELSLDEARDMITGTGTTSKGVCYNHPQVIITPINQLLPSDIETDGKQIFNVPNTQAGRDFLNQVSTYLNRPMYSVRKKGRGSRRVAGNQASVPLPHAEWIALYLDGGVSHNPIFDEQQDETLRKENESLRQQIAMRDEALDNQQEVNDGLQLALQNQGASLNERINVESSKLAQALMEIERYQIARTNRIQREKAQLSSPKETNDEVIIIRNPNGTTTEIIGARKVTVGK